jgi:hypothetical protein
VKGGGKKVSEEDVTLEKWSEGWMQISASEDEKRDHKSRNVK